MDSQHVNAVRKAVLAVLCQSREDDLSFERLYVKVLRHMLPKMPEEQLVKSVLDKLADEGHIYFEEEITGDTTVRLSSKGIDLSKKELEQFKRTVDKLAKKASNARR
jgi:hypothetical protein